MEKEKSKRETSLSERAKLDVCQCRPRIPLAIDLTLSSVSPGHFGLPIFLSFLFSPLFFYQLTKIPFYSLSCLLFSVILFLSLTLSVSFWVYERENWLVKWNISNPNCVLNSPGVPFIRAPWSFLLLLLILASSSSTLFSLLFFSRRRRWREKRRREKSCSLHK